MSPVTSSHVALTKVYDQEGCQWGRNQSPHREILHFHMVLGKSILNILLQKWQKVIENNYDNAIYHSPPLFVTKLPSLLDIRYIHLFPKENVPKISSNHSIIPRFQNLWHLLHHMQISILLMQKVMNHKGKLSVPTLNVEWWIEGRINTINTPMEKAR